MAINPPHHLQPSSHSKRPSQSKCFSWTKRVSVGLCVSIVWRESEREGLCAPAQTVGHHDAGPVRHNRPSSRTIRTVEMPAGVLSSPILAADRSFGERLSDVIDQDHIGLPVTLVQIERPIGMLPHVTNQAEILRFEKVESFGSRMPSSATPFLLRHARLLRSVRD